MASMEPPNGLESRESSHTQRNRSTSSPKARSPSPSSAISPMQATSNAPETSAPGENTSIVRVKSRDSALDYGGVKNRKISADALLKQWGRRSRGYSGAGGKRKATSGGGMGERNSGESEDETGEDAGWWSRAWSVLSSLELENKGSVARDHLALERTFLAWLRTSLAFASIGIAITQLFRLHAALSDSAGMVPDPEHSGLLRLRQVGKPLGATFLGVSVLMVGVGWRRYFESQYWIMKGKFPASRGSVFLVTCITAALIIASLVVVLTIEPTPLRRIDD